MQHHRVPTRPLDWSRNLLIGAFFAVFDEGAWDDFGLSTKIAGSSSGRPE
jgi:hypothetical protein